jgi:hypothetical protein
LPFANKYADKKMDTELEAIRDKKRFRVLRQHIEQMLLDNTIDYRQITKTLDYNLYSTPDRLDIVRVLLNIKKTGLHDNDKKKLQKIINHYAAEHDNLIVLKP